MKYVEIELVIEKNKAIRRKEMKSYKEEAKTEKVLMSYIILLIFLTLAFLFMVGFAFKKVSNQRKEEKMRRMNTAQIELIVEPPQKGGFLFAVFYPWRISRISPS